jgi:hypothetical protein
MASLRRLAPNRIARLCPIDVPDERVAKPIRVLNGHEFVTRAGRTARRCFGRSHMIISAIVYLTLIVCFIALFGVVQLLENVIARTPPAADILKR